MEFFFLAILAVGLLDVSLSLTQSERDQAMDEHNSIRRTEVTDGGMVPTNMLEMVKFFTYLAD